MKNTRGDSQDTLPLYETLKDHISDLSKFYNIVQGFHNEWTYQVTLRKNFRLLR